MIELNEFNFGAEIKRWFSKSIYDFNGIDFNDIESYKRILNEFKGDYSRYYQDDYIQLIKILNRRELQGILTYRIARHYYLNGNENIANLFSNLGTFLSGFEIYYSAKIGKNLKINHGIGTVIGARTEIGDDCLIHQGITIGDKNGGRPTLKNNIIIYPGAKLIGKIVVGNNVIIATNAVCMNDIPKNHIAYGIPAKHKLNKK